MGTFVFLPLLFWFPLRTSVQKSLAKRWVDGWVVGWVRRSRIVPQLVSRPVLFYLFVDVSCLADERSTLYVLSVHVA